MPLLRKTEKPRERFELSLLKVRRQTARSNAAGLWSCGITPPFAWQIRPASSWTRRFTAHGFVGFFENSHDDTNHNMVVSKGARKATQSSGAFAVPSVMMPRTPCELRVFFAA